MCTTILNMEKRTHTYSEIVTRDENSQVQAQWMLEQALPKSSSSNVTNIHSGLKTAAIWNFDQYLIIIPSQIVAMPMVECRHSCLRTFRQMLLDTLNISSSD
ncbi:calcineurin-like metallo-phosphoesterase super family protein, partial [Striga asiatica]